MKYRWVKRYSGSAFEEKWCLERYMGHRNIGGYFPLPEWETVYSVPVADFSELLQAPCHPRTT